MTLRTQAEGDHIPLGAVLKIALIRPFILMVCEPIVFFMSVYLTFVYSLLYLFFFAFPIRNDQRLLWWNNRHHVCFYHDRIGSRDVLHGYAREEVP